MSWLPKRSYNGAVICSGHILMRNWNCCAKFTEYDFTHYGRLETRYSYMAKRKVSNTAIKESLQYGIFMSAICSIYLNKCPQIFIFDTQQTRGLY